MKKLLLKYSIPLAIAWGLLIFILCATPGQYIPSANWLDLLSFDKFVHASIFFVLNSLLFVVAIKHNQGKIVITTYLSICIIYGGLLEVMQAMCFTNRSADWLDFIANSFGCIAALLLLKKLKGFLKTTN